MMRIERIPIQEAAAGMTVAADVRDTQGTLLVGAGTALTARLIEQLARRGIELLPLAVTHVLSGEECAAETAQLEERFACVRGQPLTERLLELMLHHRLEG